MELKKNYDMAFYAKIERVIDGDTVRATCDLGFYIQSTQTIRLFGIDAEEMKTKSENSIKAKEFLSRYLGQDLILTVKGKDSFGRWLGILKLVDGTELNTKMIKLGLAKPY